MESDDEVKISSCRICRETTTSSHKLKFEFDSEWSRVYEFCIGLQVTQYGPQTFCKSCSDKLSDYGNFKQLCLQSEEIWKSLSAVTLDSSHSHLIEINIEKEETIEYLDDEFVQHDGYDSDGHLLIIKEDKDEIKQCFDENLELSNLENKCRKRKISRSKKTNKCNIKSCGICNYSSTSQTRVDQHFLQHCQDKDLNCKLCSFEGTDMADMVLHRYTHIHLDKKLKCPLCPKKFMVDSKLTFHYRLEHLKQKGICKYCGKQFLDYNKWLKHETLHVSANYTCDHCGLRFMHRHGIINHLVIHSDALNFTCNFCGKGFKLFKNLKAHISRLHTESKQETCTICNRKFKSRLCLQEHVRIVHKERKYLCQLCSKSFTSVPFLKSHVFLHHSDEKPHACDECDARFRSKQYLKVHKRKHSGELPYTCEECGQKFTDYSSYKRHQSVHTGVRRVKCLHCDRTFHGRKQMFVHCSSKHKDKVCKEENIE